MYLCCLSVLSFIKIPEQNKQITANNIKNHANQWKQFRASRDQSSRNSEAASRNSGVQGPSHSVWVHLCKWLPMCDKSSSICRPRN